MASPTRIRKLEAYPIDLILRTPFGISGGTLDIARNVLVVVELEDGTRGMGEAAPFPAFNGETREQTLHALKSLTSIVTGMDARTWRQIASAIRTTCSGSSCARCGVESAVLDALTRNLGLPLWAWFGGASMVVHTDMTVPTGTPDQARRAALDILSRQIRTIKIKVGGGDWRKDAERIQAIHAVAPKSPLILDGNAGLSVGDALALVDALHASGIDPILFEQPVSMNDWSGLREIEARTGIPVAADESVYDCRSALDLLNNKAVSVINVKLMKCGVAEAIDIAALCRVHGAQLMVGGMVESILAMSVSACFAAGLGGFTYADLDTPLFIEESPLDGGYTQRGDQIDVSAIRVGHGVDWKSSWPPAPEHA